MAKRLFKSANYVVADNEGVISVYPQFSVYRDEGVITLIHPSGFKTLFDVPGDWLDAETGGVAYTSATLTTFLRANTGFNAASGGSGAGAMTFKDGYDAATNTPDLDTTPIAGILQGDVYCVDVSGDFFTTNVEAGQTLIAKINNPTTEADWCIGPLGLVQDGTSEGQTLRYSLTEGKFVPTDVLAIVDDTPAPLTVVPDIARALVKVNPAYTGDCIEVRRSSDDLLQDIGFDGAGHLDQLSLLAFLGTDDGFIRTWYNQGTKTGFNAVQLTNASQPRIADAGVIITKNNIPVIEFGRGISTPLTSANSITTDFSVFIRTRFSLTGGNSQPWRNDAGGLFVPANGIWKAVNGVGNANTTITANIDTNIGIIGPSENGGTYFFNGVADGTFTGGDGNNAALGLTTEGFIYAVYYYDSDQTANVTNINDHITTIHDLNNIVIVNSDLDVLQDINLTGNLNGGASTHLIAGNLEIFNDRIISTNLNGPIQIIPNGTGTTFIESDLEVSGELVVMGGSLLEGRTRFDRLGSTGIRYKIKLSGAADVDSTDAYIIAIDDTAAARTVTILTDDFEDGRYFIIKDVSGGAGTNNITVGTQLSQKIDGQDTITISENFGSLTLFVHLGGLFSI